MAEALPAGKAGLSVAKHFIADRIKPSSHADSVTDIEPGGGALVRVNGQRCAVHRTKDDTLQAVSAVCTHLGCLVAFNDAEKTWDCPCHGSRFSVDGTVLDGPATKALEHRDVGEPGQGNEVLNVEGTLFATGRALPGAAKAVASLRERGLGVRLWR